MERFNSSLKGYNIEEVNKFVDEMTKEYASMLEKLKQKDAEILTLQNELQKCKDNQNMNRYSFEASEVSNQITQMARNEARMIIDDAKKNASRIVNDALMDAEKTEIRAEQLRRNMIVFKRRMRAVIQSQMQTIDDIEEIKLED